MPKMKSHSGTKKRVSITKSGNAKKTVANRAHKLTGKTAKRKRSLKEASYVDSANSKAMKKLLPYQ